MKSVRAPDVRVSPWFILFWTKGIQFAPDESTLVSYICITGGELLFIGMAFWAGYYIHWAFTMLGVLVILAHLVIGLICYGIDRFLGADSTSETR